MFFRNKPQLLSSDSLPFGFIISKRYEIQELLGLGGMGCVYLAKDILLDGKEVAIKLLHPGIVAHKNGVKRFLQEVELTQTINHKNVVRTFDVGYDKGANLTYFTMEYVNGIPLEELIDSSFFREANLAIVSIQICDGLQAIHDSGVVHRDLNPKNLIIVNNTSIKIADFGVARSIDASIARSDEIVGSPEYIAPEIWDNGGASFSADLYSLGIILYELATGKLPFCDGEISNIMNMHIKAAPISPIKVNPRTAPWLNDLILVLLDKLPSNRPASAREVAEYVKTYADRDGCFTARGEGAVEESPIDSSYSHLMKLSGVDFQTPREKVSAAISAVTEEAVVEEEELTAPRLLLIDDCDDIRLLLKSMLADEAFEVFEACNGKEGLKKVFEHKPHAVVCDLMMPELNGRDFLQRMRSNRQTQDIPVLILTAANTVENEVDLLNCGARDFVCKTGSPGVLLARIRNFVNQAV